MAAGPRPAALDAGEGLVARAGDSGAALDEGDEGDEVTEDKEARGVAKNAPPGSRRVPACRERRGLLTGAPAGRHFEGSRPSHSGRGRNAGRTRPAPGRAPRPASGGKRKSHIITVPEQCASEREHQEAGWPEEPVPRGGPKPARFGHHPRSDQLGPGPAHARVRLLPREDDTTGRELGVLRALNTVVGL